MINSATRIEVYQRGSQTSQQNSPAPSWGRLLACYASWCLSWGVTGFLRLVFLGFVLAGVVLFCDGFFGNPLTNEYLVTSLSLILVGGGFAFAAESGSKFTSWGTLRSLSRCEPLQAKLCFLEDTSIQVKVAMFCEGIRVEFAIPSLSCPSWVRKAKGPIRVELFGSKDSAWLLRDPSGSCVLTHPKSLKHLEGIQ